MFSRGGKKVIRPGHQVLSEALRIKGFSVSDAHITWDGMISITAQVGYNRDNPFKAKKMEFVGNWGDNELQYIDGFAKSIQEAIDSEKAAQVMDEALD